MKEKGEPILQNLLFFIGGLALIFLAHTGIETSSPTVSLALEVIGFALAGYAPIRLLISLKTLLSEGWKKSMLDSAFRGEVKVVSHKENLPLLIVADAQGCVTPPHRMEIDLRKCQRLRAYCEFAQSKAGQDFPPILIYTGRAQGYVEMLAQALGMVGGPLDLPFVIENGAALYYPVSKRTCSLVQKRKRSVIEKARGILVPKLTKNEFEPKTYMITINPIPRQQIISDLQKDVVNILTKADDKLIKSLDITSTTSAVDITPMGVNKLSGLKAALKAYQNTGRYKQLPNDMKKKGLGAIVAIARGSSALRVLEGIGGAYCSAYDVDHAVSRYVRSHFGADHVINLNDIDCVVKVIEKECGLRII